VAHLKIDNVAKSYGSVVALKSANLEVIPGEIHALLGANGAGKSTLMKILTGVTTLDAGSISLNDLPISFSSPDEARKNGIAPVFQDPALIPDISLRRNLKLTSTDEKKFVSHLQAMGLTVDLSTITGLIELPVLRMIDLARALSHDPEILILDEITAALPIDLAEKVIAIMEKHKANGKSVIFISHRLAEVESICDRATVLRDGIDVDTFATDEGSEERIVTSMLGTKSMPIINPKSELGIGSEQIFLEVENLTQGQMLTGVSFTVKKGEVLGLAALEGQGQDLLFEILAGERKPDGGSIKVNGELVKFKHPRDAIARAIGYVPGDRKTALLPQRSIHENLAVTTFRKIRSWGKINSTSESELVSNAIDSLQIDTRAASQVRQLSGGNQQKVTIGRWVTTGFDLLLCFDPTRGIDVGTKAQIYALMREFADQGHSVLLFTSELREIPLVCDRAIIIYEGKIQGELPIEKCDEATLLNAVHGLPGLPGLDVA